MAKYFTKEGDDYVEVEETLHTQDDLDRVVKDRAERIARSNFSDYDDLKEKAGKVDTIKTEYEDKIKAISTEKSDLEKQLGSAKLETERVKVINEFGISDDIAEFVTGETADEMRERAEKLSKGIKGGTIKIDKKGKPKGKDTDSKSIARELFGGNKSDD